MGSMSSEGFAINQPWNLEVCGGEFENVQSQRKLNTLLFDSKGTGERSGEAVPTEKKKQTPVLERVQGLAPLAIGAPQKPALGAADAAQS